MDSLFLDTSYAIALVTPRDPNHSRATRLAASAQESARRVVTHTGVLFEVGNGLAALNQRRAAIRLIDFLYDDPMATIMDLDPALVQRARNLYRSRPDKEWGLVDCASFVVMRERGLTEALTADRHFEQAGFRALLLEAA